LNLKPERREEIDLNLTPLIDVVFLLLIFFMVSTTFEKTSKLKIDLPEASPKAQLQPDKKIVIGIDAKGRFYINESCWWQAGCTHYLACRRKNTPSVSCNRNGCSFSGWPDSSVYFDSRIF